MSEAITDGFWPKFSKLCAWSRFLIRLQPIVGMSYEAPPFATIAAMPDFDQAKRAFLLLDPIRSARHELISDGSGRPCGVYWKPQIALRGSLLLDLVTRVFLLLPLFSQEL
jgi:hypothetical protein